MKAKCYKCGWEWDYKGKSIRYLTCPKCLYKLNVKKALGKLPNLKEEIPTYLPKQKNPYKKIIKERKKEFVDPQNHIPKKRVKVRATLKESSKPSDVKDFKNMSDFMLHTDSNKEYGIREIESNLEIKQISFLTPIKDSLGNRLIN